MSNNKTPKNKTPKITKCPKLQSVQNYEMSKITKCQKLQNAQGYENLDILKLWTFCKFGHFVTWDIL